MNPSEMNISKEKFVFVNKENKIHDRELVTKPVSYFVDAWRRFKRNKASIVAACIILFLVLFAIFAPLFSPFKVAYTDSYYRYALPKLEICEKLNLGFLDGCEKRELNEATFYLNYAKGVETGHNAIKNQEYKIIETEDNKGKIVNYYKVNFDTYQENGCISMDLTEDRYLLLQQYQDETNIQVIYPMTDVNLRPQFGFAANDANYWFATKRVNGIYVPSEVTRNDDGTYSFKDIYLSYTGIDNYKSLRVEGDEPKYDYAYKNQTGYNVRVNYYEYYIFVHTYELKDGIKKPVFIFGTTTTGQDLFTCLASGARFSLIFAVLVAVVNLIVGAIYGAIEGYYGGKIDLVMERIVEILSAIPFMIVITLLKYHMENSSQILVLFIAFFLTGWIGMAGRTRMQFYRFKNQEYVLSARTLGAKDGRIMFKHIFPNALGTLITGCVLIIPGMIFSETSLSYLGIINLNSGNLTSVGSLLANGQTALGTHPHIALFPSLFISLLMLSFNLFGNGLRDAFNPSLRGSED